MNNNYVEKLRTDNYSIGSFDYYQELSKALIKKNSNLTDEEVEELLVSMPVNYRASVIDKFGNYIGFIGLYDIDGKNSIASVRFEVNSDLNEESKNEILDEYKKWLHDTLNLNNIREEVYCTPTKNEVTKYNVESEVNILLSNNMLVQGIDKAILEYFSNDYSIPELQIPFTIKKNDKVIGIIGLSNLFWPNRRANLNLFLDKNLGDDVINDLSGDIIDDYINYVHNSNIHNIASFVSGSDKNKLNILDSTCMSYYGFIPFGSINGNSVESNMMFQHIPNMKKEKGIYIPENISMDIEMFDTTKREFDPIIVIDNDYRLVSPKIFEQENIDSNNIVNGYITSMQEREHFTKPLGKDKYMIQKGDGNYGVSKAVMNYNYLLLDNLNNYVGYINILKSNANNRNAEIEMGIVPNTQGKGLGKKVITKFFEELFSVGYASVTGEVFEFNNPSNRLTGKVADLNGVRLEAYYINGRLWNINYYTRVNDKIIKRLSKRA